MSQKRTPQPETPYPLDGYELPASEDLLVDWAYVIRRLEEERTYWVATLHPDGQPHVRPVWGVIVKDTLYIGGGPHTRWARNIAANSAVSINLENGTDVVIIEGHAVYITGDTELIAKTDASYMEKYNIPHGPVWQIRPSTIFAWKGGVHSLTRFRF